MTTCSRSHAEKAVVESRHVMGRAGGSEGRSAIQALLKIVQAGCKPGRAQQSEAGEAADDQADAQVGAAGPGGAKKRGSGHSKPLSRPLIAICNDLYAPALRPLRNVAQILQFKAPQVLTSLPAQTDNIVQPIICTCVPLYTSPALSTHSATCFCAVEQQRTCFRHLVLVLFEEHGTCCALCRSKLEAVSTKLHMRKLLACAGGSADGAPAVHLHTRRPGCRQKGELHDCACCCATSQHLISCSCMQPLACLRR